MYMTIVCGGIEYNYENRITVDLIITTCGLLAMSCYCQPDHAFNFKK